MPRSGLEPKTLWCPICKDWKDTVWADEGIGPYEFWGSREVHHDWQESCPDCECPACDMLRHQPAEPECTDISNNIEYRCDRCIHVNQQEEYHHTGFIEGDPL